MSGDRLPSETRIGSLPTEVLEAVFDFLSCEDRKSAALVCKPWLAVAYSNRYLNRVFIRVPCGRHNQDVQIMLLESKREYRNILISSDYGRYGPYDWDMVQKIAAKFGPKGRKFFSLIRCAPSQVRIIRAHFPNLQELVVALDAEAGCRCNYIGSRDSFFGIQDTDKLERQALGVGDDVVVTSLPNVTKLALRMDMHSNIKYDFSVLYRITPQLKELYIYTKESHVPMDLMRVRLLRMMLISGTFSNADHDEQHLFHAEVASKRQVHFGLEITAPLLRLITSTIPQLTSLHLSTNWITKETLRYMGKLDQLKELYLFGYFHAKLLEGCVPLLTVSELVLCIQKIDDMAEFFDSAGSIAPRLLDLQVLIPQPHVLDNDVAQMVCKNFRKVRRLTLLGSLMGIPVQSSSDTWVRFDKMLNLDQLTIRDMIMKVDRFRMCRLRRLNITYCPSLTDEDVVGLTMRFPRMQLLEFTYCQNVTQNGIQALVNALPTCSVKGVLTGRQ